MYGMIDLAKRQTAVSYSNGKSYWKITMDDHFTLSIKSIFYRLEISLSLSDFLFDKVFSGKADDLVLHLLSIFDACNLYA